jgi:hypothetical protein
VCACFCNTQVYDAIWFDGSFDFHGLKKLQSHEMQAMLGVPGHQDRPRDGILGTQSIEELRGIAQASASGVDVDEGARKDEIRLEAMEHGMMVNVPPSRRIGAAASEEAEEHDSIRATRIRIDRSAQMARLAAHHRFEEREGVVAMPELGVGGNDGVPGVDRRARGPGEGPP